MTPFAEEVSRARVAQAAWSRLAVRERLRPIREFRHLLVEWADDLTAAIRTDIGRLPDDVIATDFLPTTATCKFLLAEARATLKPRRVGGRPLWLLGCRDTIYRVPHGVVGVIGTWNYPMYLNAVPILHALTSGNAVLWKPSELIPRTAEVLHDFLLQAGYPPDLVIRLPATREAGPQLVEADIDFIHFTGSDVVGRKLGARLGERLVPSVLELSGCDALIVLSDADVRLAARSAWYGTMLNAGQTCMATRRVFVDERVMPKFLEVLQPLVEATDPVRLATTGQTVQAERLVSEAVTVGCHSIRGREPDGVNSVPAVALVCPAEGAANLSICREASFAPLVAVIPFATTDAMIEQHNSCPFGLATALFAGGTRKATEIAGFLKAGAVVVNDVIVPTAHPGTPFGGRAASGWGVTQGREGLLQMTVPQVVTVRKGAFRPHVDALLNRDPAAGDVARGLLRFGHGRTLGERWQGFKQLVRGMWRTKR